MVRTKSVEEYNERRIFKSMQAFLEGEQSLNWILGIIGNEPELALRLLRNRLTYYGNGDLRVQLEHELGKLLAHPKRINPVTEV